MDINQQIFRELQEMTKLLREGGSGMGSAKSRGDEIAAERNPNRNKKQQKAVDEQISVITGGMSTGARSFVSTMTDSAASVKKAQELVSHENMAMLRSVRREYRANNITVHEATELMKKYGGSYDMLHENTYDFLKTLIDSKTAVQKFTKAVQEGGTHTPTRMEELGTSVKEAGGRAKNMAGEVAKNIPALARFRSKIDLAIAAMQQLYNIGQKSLQTGIAVDPMQFYDALRMGMSRSDLMDVFAVNRQEIEGMGQTTREFQTMMKASTDEMFRYGAGLKGGAEIAASAARQYMNAAGEGANLADQAQFLDRQQDVYKSLYKSIGMTVEKFDEMTKAIDESQDVRTQLFKLEASKRAGYKADLLVSQKQYMLDGLSLQQSSALVQKLNALAGQDGKSRVKQAAKTQAAFGAVGMGAEGERAAQLIRTGAKGEGEQQELKGLMEQFRSATGDMQSSGNLGQEIYADALMKVAGMEGIMASIEEAIMQRGKETADAVSRNTTKIGELVNIFGQEVSMADFLKTVETVKGAFDNPMDTLTAAVVGIGYGFAKIGDKINQTLYGTVGNVFSIMNIVKETLIVGFMRLQDGVLRTAENIMTLGDRIKQFFEAMVHNLGERFRSAIGAIPGVKDYSPQFVTSEFVLPDNILAERRVREQALEYAVAGLEKAHKDHYESMQAYEQQKAREQQKALEEQTAALRELKEATEKTTQAVVENTATTEAVGSTTNEMLEEQLEEERNKRPNFSGPGWRAQMAPGG